MTKEESDALLADRRQAPQDVEGPKVKALLDAAFSILQHDTGESDPEYVWQRKVLAVKFRAILSGRSHE